MRFQVDAQGVQRLSRQDIENKTIKFINLFAPECLLAPQACPLIEIARKINEDFAKYKCKILFHEDLPALPDGRRVRGRFHIPSRTIYIDRELSAGPDNNPLRFTLAHEFGHLALHRSINIKNIIKQEDFIDTEFDVESAEGASKGKTPVDWLEWQANCYAENILMPERPFKRALIRKQELMGISQAKRGYVYLDANPYSRLAYQELMTELVTIFMVSPSVIRYRLLNLKILSDVRNENWGIRY